MTPEVHVKDNVAVGVVKEVNYYKHKHGKIESVIIDTEDGPVNFHEKNAALPEAVKKSRHEQENELALLKLLGIPDDELVERDFDFDDNSFDVLGPGLQKGDRVRVARYKLRGVRHFLIRPADQVLSRVFDNERLPSYLFLGAALMTLGILFLLQRKLPDFYVRTLFWLKSLGKYRLRAVNMYNLPTEGPVILATNCKDLTSCLQMVSATDRTTRVILIDDGVSLQDGALLRALAVRYNLIVVRPRPDSQASWVQAKLEALKTLQGGHLLAVSLDHREFADAIGALVQELRQETGAPVLPVFCGSLDASVPGITPRVRVVFGEIMTQPAALDECTKAIAQLGDWIRHNDNVAGTAHH
jgi:hypothetical protein